MGYKDKYWYMYIYYVFVFIFILVPININIVFDKTLFLFEVKIIDLKVWNDIFVNKWKTYEST